MIDSHYKKGDTVIILANIKNVLESQYLFNSNECEKRIGKTGKISDIINYPRGIFYRLEVSNIKSTQKQIKSINRRKVVEIIEEEIEGVKSTYKESSPEESLLPLNIFNEIKFYLLNNELKYIDDYEIFKKSKQEINIIFKTKNNKIKEEDLNKKLKNIKVFFI